MSHVSVFVVLEVFDTIDNNVLFAFNLSTVWHSWLYYKYTSVILTIIENVLNILQLWLLPSALLETYGTYLKKL